MSGAPLASASGTFDASGKAVARVGPTVYGSRWAVDLIAVSTTSTTQTNLKLYRDTESPNALLDNTRTGNQDVSDTRVDVSPGSTLVFVWTGGTPGAVATVTVNGTLYTGR